MTTPEGRVKNFVKNFLEPYKPQLWMHWPVQTGYGAPTLDCYGIYYGKAFLIETKSEGEEPTKLQQLTIDTVRAAGGMVFVIGTHHLPLDKKFKYTGMEDLYAFLEYEKYRWDNNLP